MPERDQPDAPEIERSSYRSGFGFGSLSMVSTMALTVASSIATARLFGVHIIGEFAIANAPMLSIWFLSTVQEQPALVKRLAVMRRRSPEATGLFAATLAFSATLTAVVATLVLAVSYFVISGPVHRADLFLPAVANGAGYLVFTNTGWNIDTVLGAFQAGRRLFWIRTNQAASLLVFGVIGGVLWQSVWALVLSQMLSSVVALVHRLVVLPRFLPFRAGRRDLRSGFRALPEMIAFGIRMAPGSIANGAANQVGTWLLSVTGTVASVGAYNRAATLGSRLVTVNARITEMLFPALVQRRESGDRAGFDRALVDSLRYVAVGMLLPASAGGGAAVGVMGIFGAGFRPAATALALILLTPALLTMTRIQVFGLAAVDRPLIGSLIGVASLVVTAGVSLGGILLLGVTGAGLGLLVGCLTDNVIRFAVTQRHMATPLRNLWPLRQALALLLAYAVGFLVARVVDGVLPGVAGTLAALVAGSLAYPLAFVAAGGLGARDRQRAAWVLGRLRRRPRRVAPSPDWLHDHL